MQNLPTITWRKFPFVRFLLPFILGIIGAYQYPNPQLHYAALGMGTVSILCLFFFHQRQRRSIRWALPFGLTVHLALLALGYSLCYIQSASDSEEFEQLAKGQELVCIAKLDDQPILKGNTLRVPLQIMEVKDSLERWYGTETKIQASFELDTQVIDLKYGDFITFRTRIQRITPPANPHTFDAQTFYALKRVYYQTYVRADSWKSLDKGETSLLWSTTIATRQYLLRLLKEHLPSENEYAVASALTLGAKQELNAEVRNAYANTGAMHVLAVSGLHVGLIAWLFSALLVKRKTDKAWMKVSKTLLLLASIWIFAFLTGASASVMRASTMFSLLILGQETGRSPNVYNTLAFTAFLLLLLDPYFIFDIGFQLSFLAVIGIVYLQPKIYRRIYIKNKILDWIWSLTAVSLAAQLTTLPISWYYFHQFPVYFWLSGLIVIPMATLILPLSLLLFAFGAVPVLSTWIGALLYGLLWLMNALIFVLSHLPYAIIDQIWISSFDMYLLYAIILSLVWAIVHQNKRLLAFGFLGTIVFLAMWNYTKWQQEQQTEIWIYQARKASLIDCIEGRKVISLGDSSLIDAQKAFINQPNLGAKGIRNRKELYFNGEDFQNQSFSKYRNYVNFRGLRFAFIDYKLPKKATIIPLEVDYLFLRQKPKLYDLAQLETFYKFKYVIWDASNSYWWRNRWAAQCETLGYQYIDVAKDGAICIKVGK
ncbi:MAG: ComEC family competence protein [Saprospiraceae bacterium]|nr:ComEC family competence protein [Saprospiraceae bacterium]